MGLYIRSARSLLLAYSFVLAASLRSFSASLLPRYLVQLFRRLKGPRYADMLFVTRESRHGCSRQADATPTPAFSPSVAEIANVAAPLTVSWFFDSDFPLPVDFRRLFYLPGRAGRFQPPRGRASRRRRDGVGKRNLKIFPRARP